MNNNLVKIKLHGIIGKKLGRKEWNLSVSSVREAIHAINTLTNSKLNSTITSLSRKGIKFSIKANDDIVTENKGVDSLELRYKKLKTIDIAPVTEGAIFGGLGLSGMLGNFAGMLGGAALIGFSGGNNAMKIIGTNLFFAGLANALSEPPDPPEDRKITNPSSDPQALAESYLFSGPVNVLNEGGPVPLGYGRLIVGSQVVMATYSVEQQNVETAGRVI